MTSKGHHEIPDTKLCTRNTGSQRNFSVGHSLQNTPRKWTNLTSLFSLYQPQWDILGLISSSFGAQKKCGYLKKRPHFDHINVVKMWSFYFSGSFGAHFGLIWGSRKCGQNVVIMWSKCGLFFRHENLTKMWSKCGQNVVIMWSKCGQNVVFS